jgi:hypothetical protein
MKTKELLITVTAVLAIAALGWMAYRYEARPSPKICQVCGRMVHAGMNYRLDTLHGSEGACCPRCGMHEQVSRPGRVTHAWATDFDSRQLIPAETAYYVEGSDTGYCTMGEMPVQRQPQGVSTLTHDRCLPALVAFKTRSAAEAFQTSHSGRLLDYQEALESVKER